jgi:hypothetical protein
MEKRRFANRGFQNPAQIFIHVLPSHLVSLIWLCHDFPFFIAHLQGVSGEDPRLKMLFCRCRLLRRHAALAAREAEAAAGSAPKDT